MTSVIHFLVLFIPVAFVFASEENAIFQANDDDDDDDDEQEVATYRVTFGEPTNAKMRPKHEKLYEKLIPQGCYGPKQARDIIRKNVSKIAYKPVKPSWCKENGLLVPNEYSKITPQESDPPFEIKVFPFSKSETFRVVLKSLEKDIRFIEAILVARGVDSDNQVTPENRGRFLLSDGVTLICCSYFDKDVARFRSDEGVTQAVFYWIPEENKYEDFEGSFLYQATVVKSRSEYWVNVTSDIIATVDNAGD